MVSSRSQISQLYHWTGSVAQNGKFLTALRVKKEGSLDSWIVDSGASDGKIEDATIIQNFEVLRIILFV